MSQKIYIVGDGIVGRMTAITMHDMGFNVTIFNDIQIHKKRSLSHKRYIVTELPKQRD